MPEGDYATRSDLAALEQRRMMVEESLRQRITESEEKLVRRSEERERLLREDTTHAIEKAVKDSEGRTHNRIGELETHLDGRLDTQDVALETIQEQRASVSARFWSFAGLTIAGIIAAVIPLALTHHL